MATTYVYSLRGAVAHIAADGLNPLCGAAFSGNFFILVGRRPDGYGRCARCARRSETGAALAARQAHRDNLIVGLLVQGLSDKQLGRRLGWAPRTRTRHLNDAMRRAGARNRFQWGYLTAKREA